MYARVVMWEGGDAAAIRSSAEQISQQAGSGPPEGVPATGFTLMTDPEAGRVLAVTLFETEEDYATGDAALNAMSPPDDGLGRRAAVQKYEVALDMRT
ncbi:MAG: hypothetical protein ACXVFN_10740 [Solirubrobacteraceae bacterium]